MNRLLLIGSCCLLAVLACSPAAGGQASDTAYQPKLAYTFDMSAGLEFVERLQSDRLVRRVNPALGYVDENTLSTVQGNVDFGDGLRIMLYPSGEQDLDHIAVPVRENWAPEPSAECVDAAIGSVERAVMAMPGARVELRPDE